jgi:hypothetical protein
MYVYCVIMYVLFCIVVVVVFDSLIYRSLKGMYIYGVCVVQCVHTCVCVQEHRMHSPIPVCLRLIVAEI